MAMLKEVTVSGTVGKQTFATTNAPAVLKGAILTGPTSAALMTIRDGNASGEVVLTLKAANGTSFQAHKVCHKFLKGMHVKVLGTGGLAYLIIE